MKNICIIIHGFGGDTKEVQYLHDFLSKRGIDVRMVSLAGHGGTKKDLRASTHHDWIKSAKEAIADIAPQKVDLIGFSMGGLICAQLADMPHVNKLVFANTPIYFWNAKVIIGDIISGIFTRQFEKIMYYVKATARISFKSSIDFLRILFSTKKKFATISKPSLVLQCRNDETVWPSSAQYIKRKIGKMARLRYYKGGRHQLFCDSAAEFRDAACEDIYQFLNKQTCPNCGKPRA